MGFHPNHESKKLSNNGHGGRCSLPLDLGSSYRCNALIFESVANYGFSKKARGRER